MAGHTKIQADTIIRRLTQRQLMELDACARCGECQVWCPVYDQDQRECLTARGKIKSLRSLTKAGLSHGSHDDFLQSIHECSVCGQCHIVCPVRIDTPHLWEQAREALVIAGLSRPESQTKQLSAIRASNNSCGKPQEERGLWAEKAWQAGFLKAPVKLWSEHRSSLLYFAGCAASYELPWIAVQSARLLQEAGVDFAILGPDEPCCASKLKRMGDPAFAEEAQRRVRMLSALGAETIVVSCAGCFKGLYDDYRRLWQRRQRVLHLTQFLDQLIRAGRLTPSGPVPFTVTYHDPCHLGRHNRVYDEPRRVLCSVKGIRLTEMRRHGAFSSCCGMGGGLKLANPRIQHRMSASRVRDAEQTGADAVVTPCQTCFLGLQQGTKDISSSLSVLHLNEILTASLCPDLNRTQIEMSLGLTVSGAGRDMNTCPETHP